MTATHRLAGEISGTVGVPWLTIANVLVALLQALPAFCPQPEPEPPAEKLRRLAIAHPVIFRGECWKECHKQGVPHRRIRATVREIYRRATEDSIETLAAMCAEVPAK